MSPAGDGGGRPLTWFLRYHAPDREPLAAPSAQYVKFRDSSSTAGEAAAIGARSRRAGSGSGCLPAPPLRPAPRRRRALQRPLPAPRPGRRDRRGHLAPAPARPQVRLPPARRCGSRPPARPAHPGHPGLPGATPLLPRQRPAGTPAVCGLPGRPGSRRILGAAGPGLSASSPARPVPGARGWPHLLGRGGGASKGACGTPPPPPRGLGRYALKGMGKNPLCLAQSCPLHPVWICQFQLLITLCVSHLNLRSCLHVPENIVSNSRTKVDLLNLSVKD